MKEKMDAISYFCQDILPSAQWSSKWDETSINKGLSWAKVAQKSFRKIMTSKREIPIANIPIKMSKICIHNNNVVVCSSCVAMSIANIIEANGILISDVEKASQTFITELLLNIRLSDSVQEIVRSVATSALTPDELKTVWMTVDQKKVNREHLCSLLEDYERTHSLQDVVPDCEGNRLPLNADTYTVLVQQEISSSFLASVRCKRVDGWLQNYFTKVDPGKRLPNSEKTSLNEPNSLYNLLCMASDFSQLSSHKQFYERAMLQLIHWFTAINSDDAHSCHDLLLSEWLSLFRHLSSTLPQCVPISPCLCCIISPLLVSLLHALYRATCVTNELTCNSDQASNDVLPANNCKIDRHSVAGFIQSLRNCPHKFHHNCSAPSITGLSCHTCHVDQSSNMLDFRQNNERLSHGRSMTRITPGDAHKAIEDTISQSLHIFIKSHQSRFWLEIAKESGVCV